MASIDDDFKKIFEKLLKQMGLNPETGLRGVDPESKSWYYGYSMTLGPDGKPVIKEYGNVNPLGNNVPNFGFGKTSENQIGKMIDDEPLTQVDVDRNNMKVRVLLELSGFDRSAIRVSAREKTVKITAKDGRKVFDTEVPLGVSVDPSSAKATLNNGVLEVSLVLVEADTDDGVEVPVE